MIKYHCSNCYNSSSSQIYPLFLSKIEYVPFVTDECPDGCAQISCHTVDGYWTSSLLKCYRTRKGKYVNFGGSRIYIGTKSQPFKLLDVPPSLQKTIDECAKKYKYWGNLPT